MDFELEQNMILCYETVGQASVCQEETQEAIVPDACPDILRIVEVCVQAFSSRKEAGDGQATVSGMIEASVLYMPEIGTLLQSMPVRFPFSVRVDIPETVTSSVLEVSSRIKHADARILNPRKILLRCDLIVEVTALSRREYSVHSGVLHPEQGHICQRQELIEYERLSAVPQRIFPISEEVRLTGTQPPVLLNARATVQCTESRIIGSKLIFKGKTDVTLLLQTAQGDMEQRIESFPFSQILDAKGAGEDGSCHVRLELCEFSCVQPLDDPFHLMIEGELFAMGQVREPSQVNVLTDMYSTTHQTQQERHAVKLYSVCQQNIIPQTLRDLLETNDVVRNVCDSSFRLGNVFCTAEQDGFILTAQGYITALYLDEDRQPRMLEKAVELTSRFNSQSGIEVLRADFIPGELYTAPCAGGIEVRFGAEFSVLVSCPHTVDAVFRAVIGELRNSDTRRPSVILRRPEPTESMWDIAKACGTTREEIMQANELSDETLPVGKMLLIPSSR